jgi:hypothetical protein
MKTNSPSHYRRRSLIEPENVVPYFFSCAEAQKPKGSSEQVSKWNLVGKQNTEVFSVFFVVLFVELSEITDVVSENSPSLASSVGKLIGVCLSRPVHLYDVDDITPSLAKYFAQQRAHILI